MSLVVHMEIRARSHAEASTALFDTVRRHQSGLRWDDSDATCERLLKWLRGPEPELGGVDQP